MWPFLEKAFCTRRNVLTRRSAPSVTCACVPATFRKFGYDRHWRSSDGVLSTLVVNNGLLLRCMVSLNQHMCLLGMLQSWSRLISELVTFDFLTGIRQCFANSKGNSQWKDRKMRVSSNDRTACALSRNVWRHFGDRNSAKQGWYCGERSACFISTFSVRYLFGLPG